MALLRRGIWANLQKRRALVPELALLVLTVTRDLKVELIKCHRFTARSFTT